TMPFTADLDLDGTPESTMRLQQCLADGQQTCLTIAGSPEIPLGAQITLDQPLESYLGPSLKPLGAGQVALYHLLNGRLALSVIDLVQQTIVAQTQPPANVTTFVDVGYARAPGPRLIPYLVPSYGDSDFVTDYSAVSWGQLSIYQPGSGFFTVSSAPHS